MLSDVLQVNNVLRCIVAGNRKFNNYAMMVEKLDYILKNRLPRVVIVSGKADGADTLGEKYASDKGLLVAPFDPWWDRLDVPGAVIKTNRFGQYNARAGTDRNLRMAQYAIAGGVENAALVAFWAEDKGGTYNMIKTAQGLSIPTRKVLYMKGGTICQNTVS